MAKKNQIRKKKKEEIHFEDAPIQLIVNPKGEEKPFEGGESVEEKEELIKDVEENEEKKENEEEEETREETNENEVTKDIEEEEVTKDLVKKELHEHSEQTEEPQLSVIDKLTLGFFVLLNSLGLALKKIYKSIFGFFKREQTEQV